ncbi:uroporphyrinogen decarboxylase family protein [Acidobacteriota bacterium]
MNSRERLSAALNHEPVDMLCVDFGAGGLTGMHVSIVHRLREAVLGPSDFRIKVIEPYQMLGEIDEELRHALELDVVGVEAPRTMFGFPNRGWKDWILNDGTPVLVPENFNTSRDSEGNTYIYPEGDSSAPPCAVMPKGGYFFDSIIRQPPIDDSKLDPQENLEEFGPISVADLDFLSRQVRDLREFTDSGIYMPLGGLAFGDIALVPAPWLKNPHGVRDVEEWYLSLALRPDYIKKVFENQCEIALKNIEKTANAVGDAVDVVFVSGTDFGSQQGLILSRETYRQLFFPFQRAVNDKIHELTPWKTFIHSCGAVSELIPDFIEAGFDIFNPVQCSALGMDPKRLKNEFGRDIVFWGGGVDTQKTLPFGTPDDVYREVRDRIEIFSEGSGFVFSSIHNIQAETPIENVQAVFSAIKHSRQGC